MSIKNSERIGKRFGITPGAVRKIGNLEPLLKVADSMDINRDDVERLFNVRQAEAFTDTTESAEEVEKEVTALEEGATEDTTPVLSDEDVYGNEEKGQKAGMATLGEGSKGTANVFDFEKASYKKRVEKFKETGLNENELTVLYEQAMNKNDTEVMDAVVERLNALAKEKSKKVKRRNVKKEMEAEAAAEEGGQARTPVEKAEALWNKYAEQHGLGLFEDQNSVIQGYVVDLVYDKKDNLAGLNNLIYENDLVAATEKAQFSRGEGAGKNTTWDSADLKTLLKKLFMADKRFDELVTIVDSYDELPKYVKAVVKKAGDIQAFVYGRRVYMIASQIQTGQELPVFLHEVGVHLGMENLLGTDNYRKLTAQVLDWSKSKKDSLESIIARNAQGRVDAAVEVAKAEGKPLTTNEQLDELVAYFVEEAVALCIQPQAVARQQGPIAAWFRTMLAAMKVALRKIGFGKFDQLSANNLVDLAFGAAKLEISGTYHGTSAEFRNFKTSAIGTGEGAVAYGWGLYVAQRFGIALDYMRADVKRKFSDVFGVFADRKVTYKGKDYTELTSFDLDLYRKDFAQFMENSIAQSVLNRLQHNNVTVKEAIDSSKRANTRLLAETEEKLNKKGIFTKKLPDAVRKDLERSIKFYKDSLAAIDRIKEEDFAVVDAAKKPGQVLRNLPMVSEDKILDLDSRLEKQPAILKLLQEKMPEELKADLEEYSNLDLADMTGRELQEDLALLEDKGISDMFFQLPENVIDTIKQGRFMSKQIVSEYLRMLGIEGNTYLDRSSRGLAGTVNVNKIPGLKDVDFSGIKGFKPSYITIKGSRLNIVSTDKQNIPLDMLIPSGSDQYMEILENVLDERDRETRNMVLFSDNALARVAGYEGGTSDGKVRFSYAGKKAEKSDTVVADLVTARMLEAQGKSAKQIWEATGWTKGIDGEWRFEVNDKDAKLKKAIGSDKTVIEQITPDTTQEWTLGDVLDHPALFNAYPELRDVKVTRKGALFDLFGLSQGGFYADENKINVTPYAKNALSTLIHEAQHWIQEKEGFTPGGNENSIRLDNLDALTKLQSQLSLFIEKLESDLALNPKDWKASFNRKNAQDTLNEVNRLIGLNEDLRELYATADSYKQILGLKANELKMLAGTPNQYAKMEAVRKEEKRLKAELRATEDTIKAAVKPAKGLVNVKHELYMMIAGEVEARDTENRMGLSDAQRKQLLPGESTGILRDNMVVNREKGPAFSRTSGNIQKLPKQLQGPVSEITRTVQDLARRGLNYWSFTEQLAERASKYLKSAKDYVALVREQQAVKTRYERRIDLILQQYDKLPASLRGTGDGSVNMLLKDSTMSGKWAFQPDYMLKKVEVDPALEARFNAMPAEAQAVVKAVFKHGFDTLQDMKKGVMDNITSEYDALMKAARDTNDIAELALLQKKKAKQLKDYTTLMAIQAGKPYAPLKRFGNFVVVAKSDDYLEQEAIISDKKATEDQKKEARVKLRELEKSENHYYVSFAETKREGRKIEEELRSEGYGYVSEAFEKDSTKIDVYGGRDVQNVFYRLRNLANDSLDENTGAESAKAINRLINDLHLTLLAEQSARQSERRRKGIAGAEDDMMRSFATQGMATAHFIASLHNSGKIYDTLQEMRRDADDQTPGRDIRREY